MSVILAVIFHPDLFIDPLLRRWWPELVGVSLALCAQALLAYHTTLYDDLYWRWLHR